MRTGIVLPRDLPDDELIAFARQVDELGFDEIWVVEDLGFKGGFAQAAVILACTTRVSVGIGVAPVSARNPVYTAMEAGTLAGLFPGRLILGLGHGMPSWMARAGERVASPLTLLSETLEVVRALLDGQKVTYQGRYIQLDGVYLESPPKVAPLIVAGVRGPRSLGISGQLADGTLLAEPVAVPYLQAARELIQLGARRSIKPAAEEHRIIAYAIARVDLDLQAAREQVRGAVASFGQNDWWPHIAPLPFAAEFKRLAAEYPDPSDFARSMPDAWIDQLSFAGSPEKIRRQVDELAAAGAWSVSFIVGLDNEREQLRLIAEALNSNSSATDLGA